MAIALSWSRLSDYQSCPRKFYLKYIDKAFPQEEKNFHLIKGANLHKQLEDYVDAKNAGTLTNLETFSPEIQSTIPLVDKLMSQFAKTYSETQVAVTQTWEQTEWFSKEAGWRAIMDMICVNPTHALIVDWKSGKLYDYADEKGQLHLSGLIALEVLKVETVTVSYVFVEHRHTSPITLDQSHVPALKAHFDQQYDIVNSDKAFKPEVNQYCKYCPATLQQCPFSKKLGKR